jgi:hypothetical protein
MAAYSLHRDQSPIGDYLRRMKAKLGPAAATTATAHKIAIIFYTMVKSRVEYDASLWAQRDTLREKRIEARLHKQAAQRGYKLVPMAKSQPPNSLIANVPPGSSLEVLTRSGTRMLRRAPFALRAACSVRFARPVYLRSV